MVPGPADSNHGFVRVSERVTSDIYTFSLPFFAGFDLFSKPSTKVNMARRSRAEAYSCVDKLLILSPFFAGYVSSLKQTRHDINHVLYVLEYKAFGPAILLAYSLSPLLRRE